jgi:hypothetical protein
MSNVCPVVTIETENGPVEINKSDFDSEKHELFGQVKKDKEPKEGTVDWYKDQLDDLNIDHSEISIKADYIVLYENAMEGGNDTE